MNKTEFKAFIDSRKDGFTVVLLNDGTLAEINKDFLPGWMQNHHVVGITNNILRDDINSIWEYWQKATTAISILNGMLCPVLLTVGGWRNPETNHYYLDVGIIVPTEYKDAIKTLFMQQSTFNLNTFECE